MYTLADYIWMIADDARVAAYADALRAQLEPGMRVLDIGAGFGFFSVLAARAGASHVDAIDTNPVVYLGPKVAAANRCADRIAFHHADVTLLRIGQPADLLIADLRGPTPFGCRSLEILMHARDRLLRPGGVMIARRDTMFVAPSKAPEPFHREVLRAHGQHGVVLDPVERVIADTPLRYSIAPEDLVAAGKPCLELDYLALDRTAVAGQCEWTCEAPAAIDGLAVWFNTDLGAGVGFSSGPGSRIVAYKQVFIPFTAHVPVRERDVLRVHLGIRELRHHNVWEWRVWLTDSTGEREVVRQNSLAELVVDPAALTDTSADATPHLGPRGRVLRNLLTRLDGRTTLGTIARQLQADASDVFSDIEAAEQFVAHWVDLTVRLERGAD